jgi:hypothetical protein
MAGATVNSVAQVKTIATNGPKGPTIAMMMAVDIGDAANGEVFVSEVAEQFKLHRTIVPPNTSMLLVTLVGDLSADRFASHWRDVVRQDGVVRAYMSLMQVADVIQGTKSGQQLSKASLLSSGSIKPWWKFW